MWFFKRKKKEDKKVEENVKEEKEEKVEPTKEEQVETKPKKQTKTSKQEKKVEEKPKKEVKIQKKEEPENVEQEKVEKKSVYRVIYNKETKVWNIKKDGAKRIIDSRATKEEALKRVKELSDSQDANFVVYKKDGKFQKK